MTTNINKIYIFQQICHEIQQHKMTRHIVCEQGRKRGASIHTWIHLIHLLYVAAPVRYHHVNLIFTWSDVSRSGWVFSGRSGDLSGQSAQPKGELPHRPWRRRGGTSHMILARLVNILQGVLSTCSFQKLLWNTCNLSFRTTTPV